MPDERRALVSRNAPPESVSVPDFDLGLLIEPELGADLVWRSEGVRRISPPPTVGPTDPAFEPQPRWHPHDRSSHPAAPFDRSACVVVRRVLDAASASALARRVDCAPDTADAILVEAVSLLQQQFEFDPATSTASLARDPLDRPTTSFDPSTGQAVGLHVDAWTDEARPGPGSEVFHLDLNLGPDARSFLFVPFSVQRMARQLGLDTTAQSTAPRRIGQLFLSSFAHTPVLRVRLPQGAAYLAPVERMLHDGCSLGAQHGIVRIVVEGDVRPKGADPASH